MYNVKLIFDLCLQHGRFYRDRIISEEKKVDMTLDNKINNNLSIFNKTVKALIYLGTLAVFYFSSISNY